MDRRPGLFLVVFIDKKDHSQNQFVKKLRCWLDEEFYAYTIRIADSSEKKVGRGAALKRLWRGANEEILAYVDSKSILDFNIIKDIFTALSEHYDVAVGSRLLPESKGKRPFMRRWLSFSYNFLIRKVFKTRHCTDAQCHVKAVKRKVAAWLIPKIASDGSFFDTELIVLGEINGLNIKELPVTFVALKESVVDIAGYFTENITNLIRLKRSLLASKPKA